MLLKNNINPSNSPLGQKSNYVDTYNPELLFAIPRKIKREELGILDQLPFAGYDIWNAFEISWLNTKGKPEVAIGEFIVPCTSINIFESKSLKLYLNSFNGTKYDSISTATKIIKQDLSRSTGDKVKVTMLHLNKVINNIQRSFQARSLDDQDIECTEYVTNPSLLTTSNQYTEEELYSDLLKSNCLITKQPDWGSVYIKYEGKKIDHAGLLRYIVSFRNHNEFHEQCIERMFIDIIQQCKPKRLTIHGRYTRRGGIDINPVRSTHNYHVNNCRLIRQ